MRSKKGESRKQKNVAFFERGSWYHRTKTLQEDYKVKYGKAGGFETQKEAEESYYKLEKEFINKLTAHNNTDKKEIFFRDYLIYWFENLYSTRIESTTTLGAAYALYYFIIPNIEKDVKLKLINEDYLDAILKRCAKTTESAGYTCRSILNIAIKDAVVEGYINYNPVLGTKVYKRKKKKIFILPKKDIKTLLKLASKDNWYLEILLVLFSGLRKGELMGLKFKDLDLEKQTITISRQLVKNPKIKEVNENELSVEIEECVFIEREISPRKLKLPDITIEELNKREQFIDVWKMNYEDFEDNDYISCQENGKPHHINSLNTYLYRLCRNNAIPQISTHSLRHIYTANLIERAVPLVKISGLLGHKSINTTFEKYWSIMDEREKITAFINNNFSSEEMEKAYEN